MDKYDFKDAEDEIGYVPYDSITSLHARVDKWGLRILKEINDLLPVVYKHNSNTLQ